MVKEAFYEKYIEGLKLINNEIESNEYLWSTFNFNNKPDLNIIRSILMTLKKTSNDDFINFLSNRIDQSLESSNNSFVPKNSSSYKNLTQEEMNIIPKKLINTFGENMFKEFELKTRIKR